VILDAFWLPVMAVYAAGCLVFVGIGLNLVYMTVLAARRRPRHAHPGPLTSYPRVTIQLPIFNELYVVERLLKATCAMDWPRDRLQIQVLDDSTDETQYLAARLVRQYAAQGLNIQHVHRSDRLGFKAGALREGLATATGEYIAIFDADFVPPSNFLRETVPYFAYERVGFVQARWGHLNQGYSLFTQLQSVIIDAHFLVDQVARNRGGFFMNFNGTAGVWRLTAIEDAGGWEHDTLAEDLDLSYRAQLRGWEAVYLPDLIAYAELPATVAAYRRQQRRWAAGSFACAIKLLPQVFRAPLAPMVKFEAVVHLLGYTSHVCLLLIFLLQPLLLYYTQRNGVAPPNLAIWLLTSIPALAPATYLLYSQWRANGSLPRRIPFILLAGVMGPAIMLIVVDAILRVLFARQLAFERTPKYGLATAGDSWDGKHYILGADGTLAVELGCLCFSLATITYAGAVHMWNTLFYATYFLAGLCFIIGTSLIQMSPPALSRPLASVSGGRDL
jgi:cellulose synthase/poly-beta-1,6-N-acetylglucosamine synthase-like glycosyltransferase